MVHRVDEIDVRILKILQRDGRITNAELADKVHLSPSSTLRRVRPLEDSGIIRQYVALIDPELVGLNMTVFVSVSLERQIKGVRERFEDAIKNWPEVTECHLMAGEYDYLIRAVVRDRTSLERLVLGRLGAFAGVAKIRTEIPMRVVKYSTALPIDFASSTTSG